MIRRPSRTASAIAVIGLLALEVFLVWSMFFQTKSGWVTVHATAGKCTSTSSGKTSSQTDCIARFTYQGRSYTTSTMELHRGDTESLSVKKSALRDAKNNDISDADVSEHKLDTGRLIWIIVIAVALVLLLVLRIGIFVRAHRRGMSVREFETNASLSRASWIANRFGRNQQS